MIQKTAYGEESNHGTWFLEGAFTGFLDKVLADYFIFLPMSSNPCMG